MSSDFEEIVNMDIETAAELQDDETKYTIIPFDENENPLYDPPETESEYFETDSDMGCETDPDAIVDRAVHHIENKKRTERISSFEHGFNFPSIVRKRIASKGSLPKNKKSGKENRTTNNTINQNKPFRKALKSKSEKRFQRVLKKSVFHESQERERAKKLPVSLVSTKTATRTENESSLISNQARIRSPVVPQSIFVPQNHSQTETKTDNNFQWNVRQNSFSELLLKHFSIISQNDKIVKLKCKFCGERKRPISIVLGNNSNLKSHMKAVSSFRHCLIFQSLCK